MSTLALHSKVPLKSEIHYVVSWMGGGFGRGRIYVYEWLSPFTVHRKLSEHYQSAIPQYKIKSLKLEKTNMKYK